MGKIRHSSNIDKRNEPNNSFVNLDENDLLVAFNKIQHLNDLKSAFITTVSHEFRTPLAVMQSAIMLARHYQKIGQPEKVEKFLASIEKSMKDLNGLIDQVAELNLSDEDMSAVQLEIYTQTHSFG